MELDQRLSDMLDFYSDKASAHTTILVAVIISLFTVPALIDKANTPHISLLFLFIWSVGLWTLYNFSYNSERANWILWYSTSTKSDHEKYKMEICVDQSLQDQVAKMVEGKWNKNLTRYVFLVTKRSKWMNLMRYLFSVNERSELDIEFELGKKDFSPREYISPGFSSFFPLLYSLLGFYMSLVFFPEILPICVTILVIFAIDTVVLYWQIHKILRSLKAQCYFKKKKPPKVCAHL